MKGARLTICAICVIIAIVAAITAVIMFRNEIAGFFADIKDRINEKRFRNSGEYEDYVD